MTSGFKRLNFFRGLVTYYSDWIDNEAYRRDKRRWHNRRCHGPGVVGGYGGELLVHGRGDLSIEVLPGCALDGEGNELVLGQTQIKGIDVDGLKLPQTVYVVARYVEELVDFVSYKHNLEVRGHRRVLEGCAVEVTTLLPNAAREIELARVLLDKGVRGVKDASDPRAPAANEIDLRYVPRAGHAGSGLDRLSAMAFTSMLTGTRQALGQLARAGGMDAARDALHQAIAMTAVQAAELTDESTALELIHTLFELEVAIYVEGKLKRSPVAATPQWEEWVGQLRVMKDALAGANPGKQRLTLLINTQHRMNDIVRMMFTARQKKAE